MFMQIATTVIGVAVIVFIGYVVISSVRSAVNGTAAANAGMDNAQTIAFSALALVTIGAVVVAAWGIVGIFT